MIENNSLSPFLKWVGGKSNLLPIIRENLPPVIKNYYEPFLGGGALFFDFCGNAKKKFLSDANEELITTYKVVKEKPKKLLTALKKHQSRHHVDYYYNIRRQHRSLRNPVSRAARFIYLNKTCFNGLYRENKNGEFNVPIGSKKHDVKFDFDKILSCSYGLKNTTIRCQDFSLVNPRKGDFVYLDPPYIGKDKKPSSIYSRNGFAFDDYLRLRDFVNRLHKKRVNFLLSSSDNMFVRELFKNFKITNVSAARNINPKSKNRKVSEILIKNY